MSTQQEVFWTNMLVGAAIVGADRLTFHDFSCRVRAHLVAAFGSQNQTDDAIANSTQRITEALVAKDGWILLSRASLSLLIMKQLPLKDLWEREVLKKVMI